MFCYAEIDNNGFCIAIKQDTEPFDPIPHNFVQIFDKENIYKYFERKFDIKSKKWTDEYLIHNIDYPQNIDFEQLEIKENLEYISSLLEFQGGFIDV